jgi:trimeric autotransporter adhesin
MLKTVSSAGGGGTVGGVVYQGTWNASSNSPTLTSGVGTKGYYYVVSTAGSTNLDGETLWGVGDWAVFNGTAWQKVDGGDTSAVTSLTVTGLTGYMYANNSSAVTASTTIPVANVTGAVANTVYVIAGTNLTGGGALTGNVTINSAYNGTVTNVATGTGLSGGPITSTGTISLANTTVTAGTYGNATTVAQVVIDAQGRITSASNVAISGGSSGTVTSVALSAPSFLSVSGSPVTTTGTLALSYSGTALPVANGGTGVTASSGANSVMLRDANQNVSVNSLAEGFVNVAAAGTTTTLTASSAPNYCVTGSGGQTYQLPDATTLTAGTNYFFNNNQSSGTIVVKNNSGTTIATVQSGGYVEVLLLVNSPAAGSWDVHNYAPSNVSWSTNTFSYPGSITSATWNGVAITNSYLANSSVTLGNTSVSLGSTASSLGNLTLANVTISTGTINVQSANLISTTSSNATFATASLPLVPAGYIQVNLNGTVVKVPYYAV